MIIPVTRRNQTRNAIEDMKRRHEREMNEAKAATESAAEVVRKIAVVYDEDRAALGESVLLIDGRQSAWGEWQKVIDAAVADLLNGGNVMRESFFGMKDYDRFSGQYEGATPYGYGPRHGHTVFSIGLKRDVRNREMTRDEIGDAIYVLERLRLEMQEAATRNRRYA